MLACGCLGDCAGLLCRCLFYGGFENRFFRVRQGGVDVLRDFLYQLGSPERVGHVVVADANMLEVDRIADVLAS